MASLLETNHNMQFTPQRLERVHQIMRHEKIDAIVVTYARDVHYLTGYDIPDSRLPVACVIVEGYKPRLIISENQMESVGIESVMASIESIPVTNLEEWLGTHTPKLWDKIHDIIEELETTSGMIGLQQDFLSVNEFNYVKKILPEAGFADYSHIFWRLRQIKDNSELDAIIEAVKIAEIGLRTAFEIIAPGKSEGEAAIEIESAIRNVGGQLRGIRAAVLTGSSITCPYTKSSGNRLTMDDPIVIDITVSHKGYFAELARTLHLGTPTSSQRKLFESAIKVCEQAEHLIAPETRISDFVAKIYQESTIQNNVQSIGCSIGLDLREPPQLSIENNLSFREGMVFSLHPSIYRADVGGVKIAEMIQVTKDGCRNISGIARETF
ncbi:MAG: M24 family metallopeptidase [Candidatus Lokiarchaeota archaeon]|nr:M24 family metallopeptidase [Candidatus Lokiarchaeota archaeon]